MYIHIYFLNIHFYAIILNSFNDFYGQIFQQFIKRKQVRQLYILICDNIIFNRFMKFPNFPHLKNYRFGGRDVSLCFLLGLK